MNGATLSKGFDGGDIAGKWRMDGGGGDYGAFATGAGADYAEAAEPAMGTEEGKHTFSWEPCRAVVVNGWGNQNNMNCPAEWPQSMQMSVAFDKPLSWDADKKEWRWHKTWRLPEICVRVVDKENRPNLEVRFSIICVGNNSNELDDIGLSVPDGDQRYAISQLVDSECRFSRLRLVGTSNTHGGKRFHFLVSVIQRDSLGSPHVLASLISSAFSVYSRKDADKKRKKSENTGEAADGSTLAPFSPELFTRSFVKKISDHHGRTVEEPIENSWAGLMRYFQAPNIRFKSRHPLLLAVRFSSVVVILRDNQHFPQVDEFTIRNFLCACGFPPQCRTPNCLSCFVRRSGPLENNDGTFLSPWHISMRKDFSRPPEASRWITEHLSCVRSSTLGFIQDPSMLPDRFVATENVEKIRDLYVKLYSLEFAAKGPGERQPQAVAGKSIRMEEPRNGLGLPMNMMNSNFGAAEEGAEEGMGQAMYPRQEKGEDKPEINAIDPGNAESTVKIQFAEFFMGLHSELRQLLNLFSEASSLVVTECSEENIQNLRNAYFNFTEALAIHSHVEDTTLFPELAKRWPGVTEAYNYDHYRESGQLTKIHDAINSLKSGEAAELFLKISGFAAMDNEHMEKEEEHLLPYFLTLFNDYELVELQRKAEAAAMRSRLAQGMEDM